ncbi:PhzF family phenazine biosynthesis protein [Hymenobacter taeanensis]|uniref:PhzF family phenazine biosynthesis protein n=1 Tax=Hymenobacter taeanensis TaxID=2735321 RepID=A0A6M6BM75_9BACT|nr:MULTISPECIES: PhzF family phenazine biosynthesis protein [Hymenobacter]QJX48928.1 PhzF family phenazine biosynthesis protein [Hymenobacter taeanensis]UOQ81558.1 PhzF family phenazine biosynthesis protein [Hymenobacter sp. 5414T-23]
MASYPFLLVDAFTDVALGGNPCAVVLDADDLTTEQMQRLAREFNQSETAFVRRSEVTEFGVRYFTPAEEIPLAGHPTIATITALLHSGRLAPSANQPLTLHLELLEGPIRIDVLPPAAPSGLAQVIMTQRKPVFGQLHDPAVVLPLFGLTPDDVLPGAPVQTVSTGTPQLMVLLRDAATLRRAYLPAPAALDAYRASSDFFSPHLFCLEGATPAGQTFARHFCTPPDIAEDPVTGSATGGMAAYLWHYGHLPGPNFVAEQGHWLGRPGTVQVSVLGPPNAMEGVQIGGTGVVVVEGKLSL